MNQPQIQTANEFEKVFATMKAPFLALFTEQVRTKRALLNMFNTEERTNHQRTRLTRMGTVISRLSEILQDMPGEDIAAQPEMFDHILTSMVTTYGQYADAQVKLHDAQTHVARKSKELLKDERQIDLRAMIATFSALSTMDASDESIEQESIIGNMMATFLADLASQEVEQPQTQTEKTPPIIPVTIPVTTPTTATTPLSVIPPPTPAPTKTQEPEPVIPSSSTIGRTTRRTLRAKALMAKSTVPQK